MNITLVNRYQQQNRLNKILKDVNKLRCLQVYFIKFQTVENTLKNLLIILRLFIS